MDVSDLRKRILRALDDAKNDGTFRRAETDTALKAYEGFLERVAVPLLRQAQGILKAEGELFTVHSPADSARLASEGSSETFLEFVLDRSGGRPQVVGRCSVPRGEGGVVIEERPLAPGKSIEDLGDDDVAGFLLKELPRLVARQA